MKKLINYLLIILSLSLSSCKDLLNKESYTDYDDEIFTKPEGIKSLLNGIYDGFSKDAYYGRNLYAFEASKGLDFFVRSSSGGSFERENRYAESTSASGSASSMWLNIYATIRTATTLIENIDKTIGLTPDEKENIIGEATALRALAYFDLMRLFAYPPIFSIPGGAKYNDDYSLGLPIIENMDQVNNVLNYEIRRQSAEYTYTYIENEFLKAKALLAGKAPISGHINYVATCTLLSRLYLYMNRWEDAITTGEEAYRIAQSSYSLITYENYKTTYYKPFNSENIWELPYSLSDHLGSNSLNHLVRKPTYNNPEATNDGQVSQELGYAAFGLFTATVNFLKNTANNIEDVRGYLICDLGISDQNYKGYRKYVGQTYHSVYNLPVVRYPEILLNLAEAYLEMNNIIDADRYYTLLRQARIKGSGFGSTNLSTCKDLVYTERRKELMLEGHTFWDYFRRGITLQRPELLENVRNITIAFGYGSGTLNARLQVIYPIPLNELEANIAIRDQQNKGYQTYNDIYETENKTH